MKYIRFFVLGIFAFVSLSVFAPSPVAALIMEGGMCNCPDPTDNRIRASEADCRAIDPGCTFTLIGPAGVTPAPSSSTTGGAPITLPNPLGSDEESADIRIIIGRVIRVLLGLVGSLALIVVVYGGLLWMTSSGNAEQLKKGRDTLIWATLGLVVIFASYTIVSFLIESITSSASGTGP